MRRDWPLAAIISITFISTAHADVTVPSGSSILVRTTEPIDSRRMGEGARFTVVLESNLSSDGAVAVKAGAKVYGKIFEVRKSRRLVGKAEVTVALTEISVGGNLVPITTSGVRAVGEQKAKKSAKKVAAGAAVGAMFGGGSGAKTGAAVGATAALLTQGSQINIPANTLLDFTLAKPLSVGGVEAKAKSAPSEGTVDASATALAMAQVRTKQDAELREYSWKLRTELKKAGQTKLVRLELLRYSGDSIQRTKLSDDPSPAGDADKILAQVRELQPYALLTAGELLDFMQNAELTVDSGKITAVGSSVINDGDRITMIIDQKTHFILSQSVEAKLGGQPAIGTITFRKPGQTPPGPSKAQVEVPATKTTIVVEAFNFEKQ